MMDYPLQRNTFRESGSPARHAADDIPAQGQKYDPQPLPPSFVRVDDLRDKRRVLAHNLVLVANLARRYSGHGVDLPELIREGSRGLAHAMDSFELEGSFRFATYATRCVRQNIECAILNQMEPE